MRKRPRPIHTVMTLDRGYIVAGCRLQTRATRLALIRREALPNVSITWDSSDASGIPFRIEGRIVRASCTRGPGKIH